MGKSYESTKRALKFQKHMDQESLKGTVSEMIDLQRWAVWLLIAAVILLAGMFLGMVTYLWLIR